MKFLNRMNLFLYNKKFTSINTVLVALLCIFIFSFAFQAQAAQNQAPPQTKTEEKPQEIVCVDFFAYVIPTKLDIVCGILKAANFVADAILAYPLAYSQDAVSAAFKKNFTISASDPFLKTGWPIVRDIANIFFIFILLWIALATIFDVEQFSAKKLLPRFIISALLINFSLPMGLFVVKTANNLGAIYYNQIDVYGSVRRLAAPGEQTIANVKSPPIDTSELDKAKALEKIEADAYTKFNAAQGTALKPENCTPGSRQGSCSQIAAAINIEGQKAGLVITNATPVHALLAKQFILKMLISPVIIFVLLAVAIMLVIRYVALLFILVLGPFAFLFMILPSTEKYWHEWWEKLISWSLFLPIFAICFFISIETLNGLSKQIKFVTVGGVSKVVDQTSFFHYMLSVAFMIGSLLIAQKLGLAGASTALGMGKRWAGNIGNFAKRGALAPARFAGRAAAGRAKGFVGEKIQKGVLRLQETRFGQVAGIRGGLAEMGGMGKGLSEAEYKRQTGGILKGSDAVVANYLSSASPKDAGEIFKHMDVDRRTKVMETLSPERQKSFGDAMKSQNLEHLVAGASNNPEVTVQIMNPGLKSGSSEYEKATLEQFKRMNKRNIDPAFIQNMDNTFIQNLDVSDVAAIGSTAKGAEALSKKLQTVPQGPGYLKPEVLTYFQTVPGRALLEGRAFEQAKSEAEKLSARILKMEKEMNQQQQTPPPGGNPAGGGGQTP